MKRLSWAVLCSGLACLETVPGWQPDGGVPDAGSCGIGSAACTAGLTCCNGLRTVPPLQAESCGCKLGSGQPCYSLGTGLTTELACCVALKGRGEGTVKAASDCVGRSLACTSDATCQLGLACVPGAGGSTCQPSCTPAGEPPTAAWPCCAGLVASTAGGSDRCGHRSGRPCNDNAECASLRCTPSGGEAWCE